MRPFAPLALGVVLALGCDRLLGIEDLPRAPGDAGGPPSTAIEYASKACATCANSQCASQRDACLADSACRGLYSRLAMCVVDDVKCRAAAERASGGADRSPAYLALDSCRRQSCVDDCYGSKGLLQAVNGACGCADAKCEAKTRACIQSGLGRTSVLGGCERLIACIAADPNPSEWVACTERYGRWAEYGPLVDCLKGTACASLVPQPDASPVETTCPLPTGELSCVRNFAYGTTANTSVTMKLGVFFLEGNKPAVGAKVTACRFGNCTACAPEAGAVAVVDAEGKATLQIPTPTGSYAGCLKVEPPAPDPDAGTTAKYLDMRVFTGRNISVNEDVLQTFLLTRDALEFYGALLDVKVDWDAHGHIIGALHDCIWNRAVGAQLEIDGADSTTVIAYLKTGLELSPDPKTTSYGGFAIANVPPGRHWITAKRDGQVLARLEVEVVAGQMTDANMYPERAP
ncbi:MAG: hypothetical protein HYV09_19465 [Deltaproteobacteria bacterium]|nr:hypothetical protein [Deltaproteobacteria bacterium]